jgi:hypothetical protein
MNQGGKFVKRHRKVDIIKLTIFKVFVLFICLFTTVLLFYKNVKMDREDIKYYGETDSLKIYKSIIESFGGSESNSPNYYGGAYCDSDGNLNVYVVGHKKSDIEDLWNRAGSNRFIIQKGQYSYKQLMALRREIIDKRSELEQADFSINVIEIDEFNNRLSVSVSDLDSSKLKLIKRLKNSAAINFIRGDIPIVNLH